MGIFSCFSSTWAHLRSCLSTNFRTFEPNLEFSMITKSWWGYESWSIGKTLQPSAKMSDFLAPILLWHFCPGEKSISKLMHKRLRPFLASMRKRDAKKILLQSALINIANSQNRIWIFNLEDFQLLREKSQKKGYVMWPEY